MSAPDLITRLEALIAEGLDFGAAVNAFAKAHGTYDSDGSPYLAHANEMSYVRDGEVEIADPGIVSEGADDGAYVLAWVWVDNETAGVAQDDEDEDEPHTDSDDFDDLDKAFL